jgi:phage gp46-like protein
VANDEHLLTDIRLELQHWELRPVYRVATDRHRVPKKAGWRDDLATLGGRENLGQAIVLRLLIPRGELSPLGHPSYGSRLHELIGRQNTENTRNLVKLYILESLAQERRIERVERISVAPTPGTRDRVDVLLVVKPIGASEALTVGPFSLELES